ncbi:type I restriction enzyme HsdR N-terminal domain-containing protein [Natrinema thermotolerans]|uniref:Type I restriction enzyme HsdR N-terminal domain-containing protein n=1 Tax=Natrinema thermotolerans TaxID=121872 RepID=A0AAF0PDZ5_9EURY|nr:type I restriction enzyme HsdR N-terminal domain-containing protein [Natrinema thermotolerans]QCC57650.1 type I restriction endonuclease subunit M [Natrinema thermotolerans]WMT08729.1 type I restriction enzyme HsdR N-terminal domain-containing protein [Natrinema thermotolerans]
METDPEFLLETSEFTDVLNDIGAIVSRDFSEDEVQMVFLNEGYFQLLGYERVGTDLRSEYAVPSGYVDYITSGKGNTIRDTKTVVYEFKGPERTLENHLDQLNGYIDDTGAKFGVLTNGLQLQLYQNDPTGPKKILDFELEAATETEASAIVLFLGYWSIQEQNIKPVAEKTAKEVVDSIPEDLHIDFSEAGVELFAEHLARYLKREFEKEPRS